MSENRYKKPLGALLRATILYSSERKKEHGE